jgi:hypothetical protein
MLKDYQNSPDFTKYYDTESKRNIWVLGYFGGGSINVSDAFTRAKHFAEENNVPLNTVQIDEIHSSRRFKGFKFLFSTVDTQQRGDCVEDLTEMPNVFNFLTD